MNPRALLLLPLTWTGCESTGAKNAPDDTGVSETTTDDTGSPELPVAEGCRATPMAPNAPRTALVNLPYATGGEGDWAVLSLDSDGTLTDTGATVTAGRSYYGRGAFSPDGSIGVVPLDDGNIAVFSVDESGDVAVIDTGWSAGFYASAVSFDPSGEWVWVSDGNTTGNGGGVYAVAIDCDTGAPSVPIDDRLMVDEMGKVVAANLPANAMSVPGRSDRLVVIGGDNAGADVQLVEPSTGAILSAVDAFGDDDDVWLTSTAISPFGELVLVTDTSAWSSRENAIAAVRISGDTVEAAGIDDLFDGVGLGMSLDGTTAVASSGYADDILRLSIDPDDADPVQVLGSVATTDGSPQLPGIMVSTVGADGATLVVEVYGVRTLLLGSDGAVTDLGVTGGRLTNSGGLLVQP